MTEIPQLQTLFAYKFDITHRLLAIARELQEDELERDPEYGRGSVKALFVHLLSADRGWRIGLETGQQPEGIQADQYPDLDSLQQAFEEEGSAWQSYLASLDQQAATHAYLVAVGAEFNPNALHLSHFTFTPNLMQ